MPGHSQNFSGTPTQSLYWLYQWTRINDVTNEQKKIDAKNISCDLFTSSGCERYQRNITQCGCEEHQSFRVHFNINNDDLIISVCYINLTTWKHIAKVLKEFRSPNQNHLTTPLLRSYIAVSGGSRISQRGRQPQGSVNLLSDIFLWKLWKWNKDWPKGGHPLCRLLDRSMPL